MLIKPYIEELPELFVSYFKEILRVGYNIPRLEFYMSQGKHDTLLSTERIRILEMKLEHLKCTHYLKSKTVNRLF